MKEEVIEEEAVIEPSPKWSDNRAECQGTLRAIRDALHVLNGVWKLPILVTLNDGPKRFKQIAHDINGITDKMLSKELKELEMNQLVTRTVHETFPPTVEYARTEYSYTLNNVISSLKDWGMLHRKKILGK